MKAARLMLMLLVLWWGKDYYIYSDAILCERRRFACIYVLFSNAQLRLLLTLWKHHRCILRNNQVSQHRIVHPAKWWFSISKLKLEIHTWLLLYDWVQNNLNARNGVCLVQNSTMTHQKSPPLARARECERVERLNMTGLLSILLWRGGGKEKQRNE